MADEEDKATGSLTVDDAIKMYEEHKNYWAENYKQARIDLKMASGDFATHYGNGWDEKYTTPTGPMVVDNELPQYIHQVTNDIRQNVPSIKVLPVSDGDIETGKIFSGLFRAIEDHSHADEVCDTAAEYAVTCSIGFMRVDHDFCDDKSDEQEIIFKTVPDPLSVWLDPSSVEYDGRDANTAILVEPISKKDFERLYPGKSFISFTDPKGEDNKSDTINIAEIFVREVTGERDKAYTVNRYKFSGEDRLASTTFPGKYIPLVPIYGQVSWIDGKRVLQSLIRQARSPQRRLNHMLSKESQVLAQAPIAPILAVEGTLVNERKQYQIPGLENALEYRQIDLDGNQAPAPIRLQPPGASTGFLEAIASAKEAIKASMGIYNAGLGKREGNASGIALEQLDKSGDVATFHYPDNVRRSYGHMGEIVVDMAPIIYDTPRIVQTLNDESDVIMVGVNGAALQEGQKQHYDLTKGKYRIRITTGASYTTKRQEEAEFLSNIAQKDPNFMQIGGDILFKSMDTPGAQALSERYKKIVPQQLLDDKQDQPDPQVIQLTHALQQAQGQIQQLTQIVESKQTDVRMKQIDLAIKEIDLKEKLAEANQPQEVQAPVAPEPMVDPIKHREMNLKEAEFLHKVATESPQQPQTEGDDMGGMDETVEMLQAKIQQKLAQKQAQEDGAAQQQQMVAMQAQQEEQERQESNARSDALLQGLAGIQTMLASLVQTIQQPINFQYNENGMITRAE